MKSKNNDFFEQYAQLNKYDRQTTKSSNSSEYLIGNTSIPANISQLLWIADGEYKNYDSDEDLVLSALNLAKATEDKSDDGVLHIYPVYFSETTPEEPSLIYSKLSINKNYTLGNVNKTGSYTTYSGLDTEQRAIYLNWLCDITKSVDDIGYVFLLFNALERHLATGKYSEAVDTVLILHQHHPDILGYYENALMLAAIQHKDENTLEYLLKNSGFPSKLTLLGKYLMQMDLTPDEILHFASAVGFKNRNYINKYPDFFMKFLKAILMEKFGKASYPIYNLEMENCPSNIISFYNNISLIKEVRSPLLPDFINSPEFSSSIYSILAKAHNDVKQSLGNLRKSGIRKKTKVEEDYANGPKLNCPYCNIILEELQRNNKCPYCKNKFIKRIKPTDKKVIILRNDQLEEFEQEIIRVRTQKTIQRFLTYNFRMSEKQFIQEKDKMQLLHKGELSDKDVMLHLIDNKFRDSYRTMIHFKSEIFKAANELLPALTIYLEICYLDSNDKSGLAPGILDLIRKTNKSLNLPKQNIKELFLEHNQIVQKSRKLSISVKDAWNELEEHLIF